MITDAETIRAALRCLIGTHGDPCNGGECAAIKDGNAALAALAAIEKRLADTDSEAAEHKASFDIRWKADMRAIKRWQAATGRTEVWPDHADLCVWLMERLAEANSLLNLHHVRDGRIAQTVASLESLKRAMEAEYSHASESIFHTWSLQLGCAILALQVPNDSWEKELAAKAARLAEAKALIAEAAKVTEPLASMCNDWTARGFYRSMVEREELCAIFDLHAKLSAHVKVADAPGAPVVPDTGCDDDGSPLSEDLSQIGRIGLDKWMAGLNPAYKMVLSCQHEVVGPMAVSLVCPSCKTRKGVIRRVPVPSEADAHHSADEPLPAHHEEAIHPPEPPECGCAARKALAWIACPDCENRMGYPGARQPCQTCESCRAALATPCGCAGLRESIDAYEQAFERAKKQRNDLRAELAAAKQAATNYATEAADLQGFHFAAKQDLAAATDRADAAFHFNETQAVLVGKLRADLAAERQMHAHTRESVERNEAHLRNELAQQTQRADENFDSYERVKAELSGKARDLAAANANAAMWERDLAAALERERQGMIEVFAARDREKCAVEALRECRSWMMRMSMPGNYTPIGKNRGADYDAISKAQANAAALVASFDAREGKPNA